ncbi:MAG TPA: TonB-dependent receptor [Vicinamibacterales bacterium]|jgi:hypothetical protein
MLRRWSIPIIMLTAMWALSATSAQAQGLGGAGTVQGTVKDPTGGVMQAVNVRISNPVSGFSRTTTTDAGGKFVFSNLPPNPYHLSVEAQGFDALQRDVEVRSGVPITLELTMSVGVVATVDVVGHADLVERDPTAHMDVDRSLIEKMPLESSSGLNQVITLASPGVVADSNGFFHPIGDHAQTQFSIDNQPVTDQQSKLYSNQISPDAIESMEIITGVAPAEYGDKSSLVVHIVTKSGLDQAKPTGSMTLGYGSFNSPTGEINVGAGSHTVGNFVSVSGLHTDRFLDPPEFEALHDTGHSLTLFDRLDYHPNGTDSLHLNVQAATSSFDIPNTYDQTNQQQHQNIDSFNVAPGYTKVIGSKTLFTANGFVRQDHLTYLPSPNALDDTPATVSQDRKLTNYGVKADVTVTTGNHNVKMGGSVSATKLQEHFTLGITDPTDPTWQDADGNFDPTFAPYDLTRGGSPFVYDQAATIKQQAAYIQDDIKAGDASVKLGLRLDHYDGLVQKTLVQPRLGLSYAVPGPGTVLRASYGRTMETPYNENLLLSSGLGLVGQLGITGEQPLPPGIRNQGEFGVQQGVGHWFVVDVGYFIKRTDNGYDFNVLFNTPIVFPVAWDHSNINGFTGRVNVVEHGGFSAFVVMAHTNALFSPPAAGGVLLQAPPGEFRIDHDQKFNATTNLQYVVDKTHGVWTALSWRYDSGLVAGSVPDYATALTFTAAQQAAIGLYCGGVSAALGAPITSCSSPSYGATRVVIPGTPANPAPEDDVTNPPRIAPRNLFDLGLGVDNLLHADRVKLKLRFSVINVTNKEALYNFLSTFSGTHFVTPRAYSVQAGVSF